MVVAILRPGPSPSTHSLWPPRRTCSRRARSNPRRGIRYGYGTLSARAAVEPAGSEHGTNTQYAHGQPCTLERVATAVFGDFEWDEQKAAENVRKHGVSFEEAASVFLDLDYLLTADVADAERFVALGYSSLARMLVVVHCERHSRVRIISARPATRMERDTYDRRRAPD